MANPGLCYTRALLSLPQQNTLPILSLPQQFRPSSSIVASATDGNRFKTDKGSASCKFEFISCSKRHPRIVCMRCSDEDNSGREAKTEEDVQNIGVEMALALLRFYREEISPFLPTSCRYVPTCSEYAMEAYKRYGVVKGTVLTAWRLCRCNPFGGSGFDPPRWFGDNKTSSG